MNRDAILNYLVGEWHCKTIHTDQLGTHETSYNEVMTKKDDKTLTIKALGIRDGNDVTKNITFKEHGDSIDMIQGDFVATGEATENALYLVGRIKDTEYVFRLYFLKHVYLYQMDVVEDGKIVSTNVSHLTRLNKEDERDD